MYSVKKFKIWFFEQRKTRQQDWANIAAQTMFDQKPTTTNNSWWWHKQNLIEFIENILLLSTSSWIFCTLQFFLRLKLHAHIQHLLGIFIQFCSAYCKLLFMHVQVNLEGFCCIWKSYYKSLPERRIYKHLSRLSKCF